MKWQIAGGEICPENMAYPLGMYSIGKERPTALYLAEKRLRRSAYGSLFQLQVSTTPDMNSLLIERRRSFISRSPSLR
jgi:hypothetical protein